MKIRIFRLGRKNIIVIMVFDDDDYYYSSLQRIHAQKISHTGRNT